MRRDGGGDGDMSSFRDFCDDPRREGGGGEAEALDLGKVSVELDKTMISVHSVLLSLDWGRGSMEIMKGRKRRENKRELRELAASAGTRLDDARDRKSVV